MTQHERLRAVLIEVYGTIREASRQTGVPYRSIQEYCHGRMEPRASTLGRLFKPVQGQRCWLDIVIFGEASTGWDTAVGGSAARFLDRFNDLVDTPDEPWWRKSAAEDRVKAAHDDLEALAETCLKRSRGFTETLKKDGWG